MARSSINGGESDWKAELSQMVEQIKEVRSHGSSPQTEASMIRRLSHDGQETAAMQSVVNDTDGPIPAAAINTTPSPAKLDAEAWSPSCMYSAGLHID
jgi:hypothetical protein